MLNIIIIIIIIIINIIIIPNELMKHPVCRSYWIISLFITDRARVPDLDIREGVGGDL